MKYTKVVNEDSEEIIGYCTPKALLDAFKDKTVLVTGASGMIGSYFIYTLLKLNELYSANVHIKAFVRNPSKLDEYISTNNNVEVVELTEAVVCPPLTNVTVWMPFDVEVIRPYPDG